MMGERTLKKFERTPRSCEGLRDAALPSLLQLVVGVTAQQAIFSPLVIDHRPGEAKAENSGSSCGRPFSGFDSPTSQDAHIRTAVHGITMVSRRESILLSWNLEPYKAPSKHDTSRVV
jgi:hypothetical protein